MTIRGKILAAAAVPLMAAGVALTAGGSAHAAAHQPPVPIGYSITASNAISNSITDITATLVSSPAISVVGTPHLVTVIAPTPDAIQFGATDTAGAPVFWSLPTAPAGFAITAGGLFTFTTLASAPTPVTFPVVAVDGSGASSVSMVKVTGVLPASDLVLVTPDTVELGAPVNADGMIFFPTVPPGVSEALAGGPAGAVFSAGVLAAGAAVPGIYPGVRVTALDAAGSTAIETIDATVSPVYGIAPWLSDGHAVSNGATRENVYFIQYGSPSWDHFTIVGPGPINGHQGWVNGQIGLNVGVYGGLAANHGYTVFYQPVTSWGSTTPIPGSHGGSVYFITHN